MKKSTLASKKGFKVSVSNSEKNGIVSSARGQFRAKHNRQDC